MRNVLALCVMLLAAGCPQEQAPPPPPPPSPSVLPAPTPAATPSPSPADFEPCPKPACAVKCSPEPKDVLCKRGGAGNAELTNYFCCCCGSTGNSFKRVGKK
jgi:hypothetical protein